MTDDLQVRVGVLGVGRMAHAIADALGDEAIFGTHVDAAALAADTNVLVDFSAPGTLVSNLTAARSAGVPILIGTTGLSADHHAAIDAAAREIAVLQTANTSLGLNLLARLVQEAAARLGSDWDIDVLEMHHRHKVDAPSGTALLLGGAAARGRGVTLADTARTDRAGAREEGTIGFAVLRGGSVAGDHMVVLAGEGERIELGHRAESRAIFARGAVKAALWLTGKPAGRYTMDDVLGL